MTAAAPTPAKLAAMIRRLTQEVAARPDEIKPRHALALLLLERGDRAGARRHFEFLLAKRFAPAALALGRMAMAAGDLAAAEPLLRAAAGAPALAVDAGMLLAEVLRLRNHNAESAAVLRAVIAREPPTHAPYNNLFLVLLEAHTEEALAVVEAGLARFPNVAGLHVLHGHALTLLDRADDAVAALRRGLERDPDNLQAQGFLLHAARAAARWDEEAEAFAQVRAAFNRPGAALRTALPLHAALNFKFDAIELRRLAEDAAARDARDATPLPAATLRREGPLVVGYLSADYRDHAASHLVADLFAAHDPARVRVVAFSEGPDDGDPARAEIAAATTFVDLRRLSDRAAAERIRAEGTHILVDLSMRTQGHRPGIPAHRPAPIQAAWLGLPATTGAPWFDYLLVDDIVAPPEHADRFTEALVHLPHGYQPNRRPFPIAATGRAEAGLPEGATVLACFNAHLKIDRDSFAAWMDVLAAVPGAVLWLLAPPETVAERYRAFAATAGIDPARLIFAPKLGRTAHLARLGCADLMLDCLIYGAHTTCSDALRVGVPMLTVLGENFAARVGASLLTRAEMPELVLPNRDAFVAEAIRLGNDAAARTALHEKLARTVPTSKVFDPEAQARALEDAFEAMWAKRKA